MVDDLEDALVSDDLLGGVDSEVVAVFEEDEIGPVAAEHHEVIDVDFVLSVEVFSGSADLHVVESAHDVAESVVEEAQEQVRVLLHVQHFNLFDVDAVLSRLNFKGLCEWRLGGVDIVAGDDGALDEALELFPVLLEEAAAEDGVVEGDLGVVVDREDVDEAEVVDLDVEVVGDHVERPELGLVPSAGTPG